MAAKSSKESFWTTMPGVITAIATFITAIGGLIVVLFQTGLIGSGNPDPSKTAASITAQKEVTPNGTVQNAGSGLSATADDITYEIISPPTMTAYSETEILLSLHIRVTTKDKGINFENDAFRLLAEGDIIAPHNTLNNHYIPEHSSYPGTVSFIISKNTTAATLQVGFSASGRTATMALDLKTGK